ncbi:hypothetical protein MZM54_03625 [[Brevibacterium] frigoritolerans]|nr:hypothetical protein [Peribacillus frigoritolerans]
MYKVKYNFLVNGDWVEEVGFQTNLKEPLIGDQIYIEGTFYEIKDIIVIDDIYDLYLD